MRINARRSIFIKLYLFIAGTIAHVAYDSLLLGPGVKHSYGEVIYNFTIIFRTFSQTAFSIEDYNYQPIFFEISTDKYYSYKSFQVD